VGGSSGCACDTTLGSEGTATVCYVLDGLASDRPRAFAAQPSPRQLSPKCCGKRTNSLSPRCCVAGCANRFGRAGLAVLRRSASGRISAAATARANAALLDCSSPSPIGAASPSCAPCARTPSGSLPDEKAHARSVRIGDTESGAERSLDLVEFGLRQFGWLDEHVVQRGTPKRQPGPDPALGKYRGRLRAPLRRSCSVLAWGARCCRRRRNSRFRSRLDSSSKPDHSGRAQPGNATPAAHFPADSSLHSRPAPPLRIRTYATPATARTDFENEASGA
jgi:hypothetical protein